MTPLFAKGNRKTKENLLELRRQAHHDKAPKVALRIQGILMSLDKNTTAEISQSLKVNRTTVPIWINNWNKNGEEGLLEGARSGRPVLLSSRQVQEIHDIVESGPVAYGFNTGVWTSKLVAQIIEEEYGVRYHPGHVRKMLHKIGFSVQRPTVKIVTGKAENLDKWVRYRRPNLKKKPREPMGS